MPIFILLVSAGILFEGGFSLRSSLKKFRKNKLNRYRNWNVMKKLGHGEGYVLISGVEVSPMGFDGNLFLFQHMYLTEW